MRAAKNIPEWIPIPMIFPFHKFICDDKFVTIIRSVQLCNCGKFIYLEREQRQKQKNVQRNDCRTGEQKENWEREKQRTAGSKQEVEWVVLALIMCCANARVISLYGRCSMGSCTEPKKDKVERENERVALKIWDGREVVIETRALHWPLHWRRSRSAATAEKCRPINKIASKTQSGERVSASHSIHILLELAAQ